MKDEILGALRELVEERKTSKDYSDEEKIRAAYALNMCMVSISQIIDYDDLNILEQEYEGILNNLNLEMMPKDEALLTILKRVLDTITFFRMQEGDKKVLDKEYQQKMKNAIWSAVPNFGLIVAGGNPVSMAVSLASQVGIGYMNYRRTKSENELEYEKQQWRLQRSAMEQFNGLRRELFDTAWRLADTYNFPDEYRLTERQIKQYDEILMDPDEIRKYERLSTIKDRFVAYPPFWYHYGSTANHISRDYSLLLTDESRNQYRKEALCSFEMYWKSNKYALLREDHLASACALEHIDLLDVNTEKAQITYLLDKAVKFSGYANDILQLCAVAYLRIDEKDKAADLFRILVNEQYNAVVNAQLLSGLYVDKVLTLNDSAARSRYETLANRVNPDCLIRLPKIGERVEAEALRNEFAEKQEEMLHDKFTAVIRRCLADFSIRLGKLIPAPRTDMTYPDFYYSEEGTEQRIKDFRELFSSSYKQKKRIEYLERLSQCGFVASYFEELNRFFDEISELNCIRDRKKLQEIISDQIISSSKQINSLAQKIEEEKIDFDDICLLLGFTSLNMFKGFIKELESQIDISILGMNEMSRYASADSNLRDFCNAHNITDPDQLICEGTNAKPDTGLVASYFSINLLGENCVERLYEQERYRKIESIIRNNIESLNSISDKANAYIHDSEEFNTYFEASKLKEHKEILQKTIAIYDDKSLHNVDVLFTVDGIVPIVRNSIKAPIPYLNLLNGEKKDRIIDKVSSFESTEKPYVEAIRIGLGGISGLVTLIAGGSVSMDTKVVNHIVSEIQPMIYEICTTLIDDIKQ